MDFEAFGDERGQIVEILAVLGRKDDAIDADPFGRDDFLFDAADRQHFARQRHLARHGKVLPDRLFRRQR